MLSVCGPLPLPPPEPLEPLLVPLQPAIPAATQANRTRPAAAYPIRLPIDKRRCIARSTISSTETMPSGSAGTCGRVRGFARGINCDSAVVTVAVHTVVVVLVPAVGVHATALERLLDPFLNCTVPVGPTPLLVVFTMAVNVTRPPHAILVALQGTVVVAVSPVTLTVIAVPAAGT